MDAQILYATRVQIGDVTVIEPVEVHVLVLGADEHAPPEPITATYRPPASSLGYTVTFPTKSAAAAVIEQRWIRLPELRVTTSLTAYEGGDWGECDFIFRVQHWEFGDDTIVGNVPSATYEFRPKAATPA